MATFYARITDNAGWAQTIRLDATNIDSAKEEAMNEWGGGWDHLYVYPENFSELWHSEPWRNISDTKHWNGPWQREHEMFPYPYA